MIYLILAFIISFIFGYLAIALGLRDNQTIGIILIEDKKPWISPTKLDFVRFFKKPKKKSEERAYAPSPFFDQIAKQCLHSHNLICSSEPT